VLLGLWYCGSARSRYYSSFQRLSRFTLQDISADNPWSSGKRVVGVDIAAVDGKPESSRTDVEQRGGIRQVHPRLLWQIGGLITSNAMMAAQRRNSLSCPTVAAPGKLTITVQNAGNEIVTANASQNGNGFYQLARCLRAALATTPARHPQFCMCAALPVQGEDKFSCRTIHINEYFLNQRAKDALLQPYTGG